ncbi:CCSMST1 domain containing protein [Trichuris trichiura]|uniref:CCSMST1 domain containing protein n=1 Tax=Trichuris trichiura TaxID=36087 RepID=A0A077ZAB0_TRITR|nr:CCSMST1 domain containing protein [Trichuris trichiura]
MLSLHIVQLSRSAGRRFVQLSCLKAREEGAIKFSNTPAFRGRQRKLPALSIPSSQLKDPVVRIVEAISIGASLITLLLYFGFIREENDIDEAMDLRNAARKLDDIEKELLFEAIARGKAKGQDVSEYERRLENISKRT